VVVLLIRYEVSSCTNGAKNELAEPTSFGFEPCKCMNTCYL
jgi:hypothetical protein